jgi:putative hemolysin
MNNTLRKVLLSTASLLTLVACDSNNQDTQTKSANPASVYCGQTGGTHSIKLDAQGAQSGDCSFADGQQCDEWALFRGECVPNVAVAEPFQWCAPGINSPVMSGKDQAATLPEALLEPMIIQGLVTHSMPVELVKASRWRCMTGDVWVCMVGANLPCNERADLSKTPSEKMLEFCQSNPDVDSLPAYVTGRATVYEWTCENAKPIAGNQFVKVDAAGYLANIWYQLEQ